MVCPLVSTSNHLYPTRLITPDSLDGLGSLYSNMFRHVPTPSLVRGPNQDQQLAPNADPCQHAGSEGMLGRCSVLGVVVIHGYTPWIPFDSYYIYIFWGFLNRCKIITCAGGAWVIDTLHLHMHANYYLQIIGMNELYNIFMSSTNVVLPGALSVEAWWYGPDQVLFKGQGCWWNICSTIEGWIGLMWIQSSFKSTNSLATWNHTMLKCYACVVWGGSLCNSIRGEFRITTQHI